MTKPSIPENTPSLLQCDKSISKPQTTPVTGTLSTLERRTDNSHSALTCSETTQSCRNTTLPRLLHQRTDEAQQNSKPQRESLLGPTAATQQYHTGHLKQAGQSKLSPWLKTVAKSSHGEITPTIHLCTGEDLHHAQ